MSVIKFRGKHKTGIIKTGRVIINSDASVICEGFSFYGVDLEESKQMALSWAMKELTKRYHGIN